MWHAEHFKKCKEELLAGSKISYWPINHHTRATLGPWVQYTAITKTLHTDTNQHSYNHAYTQLHMICIHYLSHLLTHTHTHMHVRTQTNYTKGLMLWPINLHCRQHDLLVWHGLGQEDFSRKLVLFQSWSFFKEKAPGGPQYLGDMNKSSRRVLQPYSGRHISRLAEDLQTSLSAKDHSCRWRVTPMGTSRV